MKLNRLSAVAVALLLVFMVSVSVTGAVPPPASEKVDVLIGFHRAPNPGLVRAFGGEIYRQFTIVDVIAARMAPQAAEALARNSMVRYVELDAPVYATSQTVPWGIDRVFDGEESRLSTWSSLSEFEVAVAVLDTGIDTNHQDLPTLLGGINTIDDTDWGSDGSGHGTHVAGTIAALDNDKGVVGVVPGVGLYAVKVLNDGGSGTIGSVVAGIEWAVQKDVLVINMSLGGSHSDTLKAACDAAYTAGHLLVSSAGNSGNPPGRGDNVSYPAAYDSVIAVAASTSSDNRASFSSTGPAVELIAPGSSILSTLPGDNYGTYSGTSMASPHVAGVAALAWAANTALCNEDVRAILAVTAEDLGLQWNHQGNGLVRGDLAVAMALGAEPPAEPAVGSIVGAVSDEGGTGISGATVFVIGAEFSATVTTEDGGSYTVPDVPVGTYTVEASADGYEPETVESVAVEDGETTVVDFTLAATGQPESMVTVVSITYSTTGGRSNDRHLHVTLTLQADSGDAVAGAIVTINLLLGDSVYRSGSGTTGSDGKVTFSYNNAPSGTYTTQVTGVAHELEWDGKTPDNSFSK